MAALPQKSVKLAKLYTAGNDLSKQWFVFFSVPDPIGKKLKRIRIYDGFAQHSTVADRIRHGEKLITHTNEKLISGWNPLKDLTMEAAQSDSSVKTLLQELFLVLEENRHNLRKKSYSTYRSHLRGFASFLSEMHVNDISIIDFKKENAQEFIKYLNTFKKAHPTTRNSYAVTLKALFEKLIDKSLLDFNPFGKIRKVISDNTPALYFQDYQKQKLKAVLQIREPQLWLFIQFMYFCFIRPIEIRCLKVGDIHGDKIFVRSEISKNKKSQYVAIPPPLLRMIEEAGIKNYPESYYIFGHNGKPAPKNYSVNHFGSKHLAILRELQFSRQHKFYSWKHTGVIDAYRAGADLKELQMQLRHHSLDMVNKYMKALGVMDSDFFKNRFREI